MTEELIDLFQLETLNPPDKETTEPLDSTTMEQVWHLLVHAVAGTEAPSCLQIHGWLQGQEVLMLIDSGSSASFISQ